MRVVGGRLRRYAWLSGSLLAPQERLFPGLGARLSGQPPVLQALLAAARHVPSARLRAVAQRQFSQPLLRRVATRLEVPVSGFRMRVNTADAMGRVLAVEGLWEPHVTAVFRDELAAGDVCVDVGANVGYHTLLAAELVGSDGHVYALEPSPETYAELVANIGLNRFDNVTALCVAAGGETGEAVLDNRAQSVIAAIRPTTDADGVRVPVQPLAELIPEEHDRRLRLVKIDVEGYELEVLRGIEPLLARGARPAILVELHAGHGQDGATFLLELSRRYELEAREVVNDEGRLRLAPWLDHTIHSSGPHILLRS